MLGREHLSVSVRPNPVVPDADRLARLERELAETSEQQTATSEVLELMAARTSSSSRCSRRSSTMPYGFATRTPDWCYQLDGDATGSRCWSAARRSTSEFVHSHPIEMGDGTLVGRVGLERRIVQIPTSSRTPITVAQATRARRIPDDAGRAHAGR